MKLILLLLVISPAAGFAADATTQPVSTPTGVFAVRRAAGVSDLRVVRHMLLDSSLDLDRRDRAVHILDQTIVKQMNLVEEASKDPGRSDALVLQATENVSKCDDALGMELKDSDDAELAAARRLATFEERIFSVFANPGPSQPDRFLEILAKLSLTPMQKETALKIRSDAAKACDDKDGELWGGTPVGLRCRFGSPDNFSLSEEFAIGAVAAEKFRAVLTSDQLKVWVDELSGAKTGS